MTTDVLERDRKATASGIDKLTAICAPLMQRSRKDGRFRYPAKDVGQGSAEDRQRDAIRTLISGARDIAKNPLAIMTRRDFEETRAKLRTAANALYTIGSPRDMRGAGIDPFLLVAPINEIETEISEFGREIIIIERDRGSDPREQAVAAHIAQLCYSLFGNVMSGVVAGLTEALLGAKVERHSVRNWWKAFVAK